MLDRLKNGVVLKRVGFLTALVVLWSAVLSWAGLPSREMLPFFLLGAAVMVGMMAGVGYVAWYLLGKPLPVGHRVPADSALKPNYRRMMALLVTISGINIVVGGFWDEVWHRLYGIPFGEDLLWRPHLMLYSGFGLVTALAFLGLIKILRSGRGTLQQRFRADPVVGLLVLVGGFLIYALPVDPLWHIIYGEDISAWSLPHLVLSISFALIMLLAAAIQLSTLPVRRWASVARARANDLVVLLIAAFMMLVLLQVLVTEWDVESQLVITLRPAWLLPAVLVAAAAFAGTLILRATRLVGAATITGLLALGIRMALIAVFGYNTLSADPWIVLLPALVALDAWYAFRLRWNTPGPLSGALAALVGMAAGGYPLVNALFFYPRIGLDNLPIMLLTGFIAALGGSWLGTRTGDYLATANKQLAGTEAISLPLRWVPAGGLGAVLAFIVLFILTATPPV